MKTDKKRIILQVEGMSCTNCAKGIKKQLESKGIEGVNVNFSTGETSYNLNNKYTEKQVENIIKKSGYSIVLQQKEGLSVVEKYFYFTLLFTPILFSHMFFTEVKFLQSPILQFFLCLSNVLLPYHLYDSVP